jgi:hypothetical protein
VLGSAPAQSGGDSRQEGELELRGHAHEVVAPAVHGRVTFDPVDWTRAACRSVRHGRRVTRGSRPRTCRRSAGHAGRRVLDVTRFRCLQSACRSRSTAARPTSDRRRHDAAWRLPPVTIGPARRWTPRGTSRPGFLHVETDGLQHGARHRGRRNHPGKEQLDISSC